MKRKIIEEVEVPSGVSCELKAKELTCKKDSLSLSKKINIPGVSISVKDNKIIFLTEAGNKNELKVIKSYAAHVRNMFSGLNKKFVYKLEACNVHFPMTLKKEGDQLIINNFLGEKVPRHAKILPDVEMELKGQKITLSSLNGESAGHTAANIEKATRIKNRDRRIFQDGIFIVEKPERNNA